MNQNEAGQFVLHQFEMFSSALEQRVEALIPIGSTATPVALTKLVKDGYRLASTLVRSVSAATNQSDASDTLVSGVSRIAAKSVTTAIRSARLSHLQNHPYGGAMSQLAAAATKPDASQIQILVSQYVSEENGIVQTES